jgi:hypothetical protein
LILQTGLALQSLTSGGTAVDTTLELLVVNTIGSQVTSQVNLAPLFSSWCTFKRLHGVGASAASVGDKASPKVIVAKELNRKSHIRTNAALHTVDTRIVCAVQ